MATRGKDGYISEKYPRGIVFVDASIVENYDDDDNMTLDTEKCFSVFNSKIAAAYETLFASKSGYPRF